MAGEEYDTIEVQQETSLTNQAHRNESQQAKNADVQIAKPMDRSTTFIKVFAGVLGVVAIVLVIVLPIYFEVIQKDDEVVVPVTSDELRFDCHPQPNPTEESCVAKGCIWDAHTDSTSAPKCFYAEDDGYVWESGPNTIPSGYSATIRNNNPVATARAVNPSSFELLDVIVTRLTKDTVRIKIVPTNDDSRFEVPFTTKNYDYVSENDALYTVKFITTNAGMFGVQIQRKSNGRVLFDTSAGRMTFADQFLQLSTYLPSEYIYGFGEHMHESFKHDMQWKSYGMFSRDQGVGPNANLYGVHPYYMCMEGDGNAHGVLFLNSNAQDVTLQPTPALTYRTVGGIFDYYIFLGPEPESVVSQYTDFVGRPYMPPYWALGFQLSRYGYGSLDKLKKVVDRNLAAEIPYDVQYTDIDYMDRQLDFTINGTTYVGLEDFARDIKNNHKMKYIIIFDPAISGNETKGTYPPFDLGEKNNVFINKQEGGIAFGKVWPDLPDIYINTTWDWDSQTETFRAYAAFPDYFNPTTKEWWYNLTVDFHNRLEFDGLWIDMNEPASFVHGSPSGCPSTKWDDPLPYHPHILGDRLYEKTTCMSNQQYNPITGESEVHYNLHSLYGWSQGEITLDACRAATGERCIVISRSTFPGSGKFVGHWLGDNASIWSHLSASIIGMLEFNLFGIPYIGADICGFFQDTTEELCMRWMQVGAFYPFSRNHNGLNFKDQDPAVFGPSFVAATKKIYEVRYRLLPHFYTLFYDAHTSGSTVIRSLMAEFPKDRNTYTVERQFLLGGHLLITPALDEGVTSVRGYVPDARWYDFYTGAKLADAFRKNNAYFDAPWDHMPIHVRGGAIIPTQTPARTTEIQRTNPLGVMYAIDDSPAPATGHLFWDDGKSIDTIENGKYILVNFQGTQESLSATVVHNDYADASTMSFDHLLIYGVMSDDVNTVLLNGVEHSFFIFDAANKVLRITDLNLSLTENWSVVWDGGVYVNRFDCHPETSAVSATENRCINRGCLWDPVNVPGVPWCYYPENYGAYKKDTAPSSTALGEELYLERLKKPVFFADEVQRLKVEVESQSEYQLRIKISDPNAKRYEVPLAIGGVNGERPAEPLYEVIYQDEPFAFKVVRRSTREVIMDTSVGALIFEDQFLQISSKIPTTHMYGFGEAEHASYKHDFSWWTEGLHARDEGVKQDANLYGYHPYHMTMEKNGDAHSILFLNSNAMEVALTPLPSITYRTIGGVLDFYFFLGPTPEQVVQQYTKAIGYPMMPPYWALGFQLCKYGYGSLEEVQKVVDGMKSYQIPYDVQYGDIDYMERQLDFTIDPVNYAGLSDYVNTLRNDYNMRYVMILDPAISANETAPYPAYSEGESSNIFIRGHDGKIMYGMVWPDLPGTPKNESTYDTRAHVAFPDFFKEDTSSWWSKQIQEFYKNITFDGIWIDMNEPANFYNGRKDVGCPSGSKYDNPPYRPKLKGDSLYDKTICMSSKQHNPGTNADDLHYNLHSLYGWSQAGPTMSACRNTTGKRCYVISRSTYPGAGKYTGHWLGDNTSKWSHLKSSIIGMFEFGLFGFAYTGADICGFFEDAEEEMCMRWSQLGAFYPFSRNHAMLDTRRQDPAAWGPDFAAAVKNVLETRYTLLPYLYTLHHHANTKGSTVVRPLMHEFRNDQSSWGIDTQFLWGSALLISPVLEPGKTAVDAYFPDARWFDYYNGEAIAVRGATTTLPAPKEHINLHVRGGYIIPTQDPATTTQESRQNNFGLLVALDDEHKASGDLYWDDGESMDTIPGKQYIYSTYSCEGNVLENKITHDGFADSSSMTLGTVTVMGLRDDVTRVFLGMIEIASSNYTQDSATKTLRVTVSLQMNQEFMLRWEVANEWTRIDCLADLLNDPTRTECERRGCVWRSSTTPGVPFCFFSSEEAVTHGYKVLSSDRTGSNDSYTLSRLSSPSLYLGDISNIQLDVEYQTNKRLHFKFFHPDDNTRWEIPETARVLDAASDISNSATDAVYSVAVTDDPFAIKISRKDDGQVMFDSSIGPLVFADQFLQISTGLPSLNFYGFGEHNHRRYRHTFNWKRWAMFSRDVAPVDEWNLYGHQPFALAMMNSNDGKCFGLYFHNTNAMDVILQPTPAATYRVTGGVLDFYIFVGDSPEEVIQEYHQLIGRPVMPPYWSLGFQLSRWDYKSLDRVKEVVNEMRAAKIPFDVQYGDIDYMDAKKAFTYDHDKYNGLPAFVDQLHSWGMKYIIILDPGIKIEDGYDAYDKGKAYDIFIKEPTGKEPVVTEVWPGQTYHPDYTHPNVEPWWTEQCQAFFEGDDGVEYDALWIDMNEPANFQPDNDEKLKLMNCTGKYNLPPYMPNILGYWVGLHDKSICMDNLQSMGMHYDVHSLYGHSMSVVTYDTLKTVFPEKRSLVLTRSTFAGTGKYAGTWLGDNQSLWPQMAWAIPAMFEFNLFGFPYIGADICGFYFNTTMEMCQRWMQVGAFFPFSRNHNAAEMIPQHPTAFGPAFANMSRDILNIRYSLLPYMYTKFYEVNTNGGTLVRALVHEFPTDQMTWNQDRQFLLGPAFLVTPVLDEGAVEVTAYFPSASRWFDFYTGKEQTETGKFVALDAPLDFINLHLRGGHILPMQNPEVTTTLSREKPLSLLVALDHSQKASGNLYWDDGESRNVGENYFLIAYECNTNILTFTPTHTSATPIGTDMLLYEKVTVYGLAIEPTTVTEGGFNNISTFNYDPLTQVLEIYDLNISFEPSLTTIEWS
ncbi:sucrase-isomaltase, intestinal-like [Clavelina lepadiformis]|uniref:sucrase-isomaltase, intestinal-like n=1 Tax=Clavelina lepadiformis TaxID=159417 RepID=UPI004043895C